MFRLLWSTGFDPAVLRIFTVVSLGFPLSHARNNCWLRICIRLQNYIGWIWLPCHYVHILFGLSFKARLKKRLHWGLQENWISPQKLFTLTLFDQDGLVHLLHTLDLKLTYSFMTWRFVCWSRNWSRGKPRKQSETWWPDLLNLRSLFILFLFAYDY